MVFSYKIKIDGKYKIRGKYLFKITIKTVGSPTRESDINSLPLLTIDYFERGRENPTNAPSI